MDLACLNNNNNNNNNKQSGWKTLVKTTSLWRGIFLTERLIEIRVTFFLTKLYIDKITKDYRKHVLLRK